MIQNLQATGGRLFVAGGYVAHWEYGWLSCKNWLIGSDILLTMKSPSKGKYNFIRESQWIISWKKLIKKKYLCSPYKLRKPQNSYTIESSYRINYLNVNILV